jgi:capsular exopolysaccharide synthesis family protein
MSRYYNQLWGRQKEAAPEAPAPASPPASVLDDSQQAEPSPEESKESFLAQCRKLILVRQPSIPVIFGQEEAFPAALDCYRSLRTKLVRMMKAQGLHSVVISSPNAAEGKTLSTLNLGLTCAKLNGQKILLVDSDLRTGGLTTLLGARSEPGLSDILNDELAFESAVLGTNVENLYVVTAGTTSSRSSEAFATDRWKQFIGWTNEHFSIVLVDAPPILPMTDFELIIAACHGTLVVARALKTSRESLSKAVKQIDSKKFLGTVFNEAASQAKYNYYAYGSETHQRVPAAAFRE